MKARRFRLANGKRRIAIAACLTRFEFGEGHGAQTGIEVKVEFAFRTSLAIAQTGKLFGITKEKLNLKTGFVIPVELQGIEVHIGAEEHRVALALGMDNHDHLEVALQLHMIEHLMV